MVGGVCTKLAKDLNLKFIFTCAELKALTKTVALSHNDLEPRNILVKCIPSSDPASDLTRLIGRWSRHTLSSSFSDTPSITSAPESESTTSATVTSGTLSMPRVDFEAHQTGSFEAADRNTCHVSEPEV
jgi:hypothetical protein